MTSLEEKLLMAIPKKLTAAQKKFEKLEKSRGRLQNRLEALQLKVMSDPVLHSINQKFLELHPPIVSMFCPKCGASDRGNRMNGKPWCFKCDHPLSSKKSKREIKR